MGLSSFFFGILFVVLLFLSGASSGNSFPFLIVTDSNPTDFFSLGDTAITPMKEQIICREQEIMIGDFENINNQVKMPIESRLSHPIKSIPIVKGSRLVCPNDWETYFFDEDFYSFNPEVKWIVTDGGSVYGPDSLNKVLIQWGEEPGLYPLRLEISQEQDYSPLVIEFSVLISGTSPEKPLIEKKGNNLLIVNQVDGPSFSKFQWGKLSKSDFSDQELEGKTDSFCWFDNIETGSFYYWVEAGNEDSSCKRRSFFNPPDDLPLIWNPLSLEQKIRVFPVPSKDGNVNIHFGDKIYGEIDVIISDIFGKTLQVLNFHSTEKNQPFILRLDHYPAGPYLIKVVFDSQSITKKILIQ